MTRIRSLILRGGTLLLFFSVVTFSQTAKPAPPILQAGSPEDKALRVIENEGDAAKRIRLLDQFVKDFPALADLIEVNQMYALAYQQSKNAAKVMEHGEKVLAFQPNDVVILPLLINTMLDQQIQIDKVLEYARRYQSVAQNVAESDPLLKLSDAERARIKAEAQNLFDAARQQKEYAVMQASYRETNLDTKIGALEGLANEFPDSPQLTTVYSMIAVTYLQKKNAAKGAEYAEKCLKRDPNNLEMLVTLGDLYSEDRAKTTLAAEYVKKAVELSDALQGKPAPEGQNEADWNKRRNYLRGTAHGLRGYLALKSALYRKALPDLELAYKLLGDDSATLYRLGFALAKLRRNTEATTYLSRASKMPGPYQQAARNALAQLER